MDTGVCTTCGAEDVELNPATETCEDCGPAESAESEKDELLKGADDAEEEEI